MNLLNTKRIIKLGLVNFWRNRWLSAQATLILTVTLIFVSVFLLSQMVVNVAVKAVKEKIDLTVYFEDSVPESQIKTLQLQLASRSDVKTVRYISKEEALQIWQGRPLSPKIKGLVSQANNPLPRSIQIKTDSNTALEEIANLFSQEEFKDKVRRISYQETKGLIERLLRITNFVTRVGLILAIVFVVISIVVILNTIRLTIFTRREEIEIMRLVGASSTFVKVSFLIEASLYGIFAALIALATLALAAWFSHPVVSSYFSGIGFDFRVFFLQRLWFLIAVAIGLGIGLSVLSALWEIRRHLKF